MIFDIGSMLHREMSSWRRHLHAHPETAFQEHNTAQFVAETLAGFGIAVHRGLARTGVVGTLSTGAGPSIGLRADMDALGLEERNDFAHRSTNPGKMHACGHDGHTAMLLGAARYLAQSRSFRGTVHFIFQPAEENEAGGQVMVEQGLFRKFPVDAVFGLHNWPGLPVGRIAVRAGPIMAACDLVEITLCGRGCHAAMPHHGTDVILAASSVVGALHTLVGRVVDPRDSAIVSITQVHAGETWNVIPDKAVLRGTVRTFEPSVQDTLETAIGATAEAAARMHRCDSALTYQRSYPATVNDAGATLRAAHAAALAVGEANVEHDPAPSMGSEDFAFMLKERPGCYVWLGNGATDGGCVLHNPHYDFNDDALPIGARYWTALVESLLPRD
ncbi:MAG: amidohydrolase [Rhodospirillales bacterium]|nr:amidohydrolase [Rhodospirillales bacterium]